MLNKILFRNITLNNFTILRKSISVNKLQSCAYLANEQAVLPLNIPISVQDKFSKNFENKHAHSVMHNLPAYSSTLFKNRIEQSPDVHMYEQEFQDLLNKHWRSESATEIVKAFITACSYSKQNNISLCDKRFDKLVDGLMDKCQDLTDDELSNLLACIREYPVPETISSHNFNDVWSALDDICMRRHMEWPIDKLLLFADHWYLLGLAKYSDYIKESIKRLARKVHHLSPAQLVHCFFLINVCRKPWDMFDFECQLEKHIDKLTLDELGIVSMSFFKTETRIKGTFLLGQILQKLLEQTKTVNEITLSAILKVLRYSPHLPLIDLVEQLLVKLEPEIERLSILCCIHIALAGTNAQSFNPKILTKISEKFLIDMSVARLKDLERLTFTLSLFNFNPPTSRPIYPEILKELYKPERDNEMERYPRCFSCCIHYLGLQQIYPDDLISRVLDKDFLRFAYGSNQLKTGREILFIDTSLALECPDYAGNRISDKLRHRLSKWSQDWLPNADSNRKISAADKLLLDVAGTLKHMLGGPQYINITHILPHFHRPDILICKDATGNPVKISHIHKASLEEILRPVDGNRWFAVIPAGWNSYIRGTTRPTGILATKMRQLQKIGYTPIMVPWHDFAHASTQQRHQYIDNKIR